MLCIIARSVQVKDKPNRLLQLHTTSQVNAKSAQQARYGPVISHTNHADKVRANTAYICSGSAQISKQPKINN